MKKLYTLLALACTSIAIAQPTPENSQEFGGTPNWQSNSKAPGDSCGVYNNNYIGLAKTSNVFYQAMRTGNGNIGQGSYNSGFSQKFTCPQPIDISGIQFFAFESNPALDSLMAITILYDYTAANDSVGVELARDTVYVKHQAFTININDLSVIGTFPAVTVTSDYMITVQTPTDDSLKIITSSGVANDGAGEGAAYIYYENPAYPSFTGHYNMLAFGAGFDYDILINPRIKFDFNDSFTVLDDSICPGVVSAGCVNYTQKPIYSDIHYNSSAAAPASNLQWLWGDGFQNTNILSACHTYNTQGTYNITLNDTLYRWVFGSSSCVGQATEPIVVIDDVVADFTSVTGGIVVDFTSTSTSVDSLFWDFGDGNTASDSLTIQHNYDSLGTFDVWLYAYNECGVDSIMYQVTTDDVGFEKQAFNFAIYPNPASSNVVISGLALDSKIEVINILGETIQEFRANSIQESIDLNLLSNGTYFIRMSTDANQLTKKLVVKH